MEPHRPGCCASNLNLLVLVFDSAGHIVLGILVMGPLSMTPC